MEELINKFLIINGYKNNKDVLGVIFYGSRSYHTDNINSDLDLLIITNRNQSYKGVLYIDGIKVEYFERSIQDIYKMIDNMDVNNDTYLKSIFKNGTIIYSDNGIMEYLKYTLLDKENKNTKRNFNSSSYIDFYDLYKTVENPNFKLYCYYNLLELLRKKYHIENGYSKIPMLKSIKLYSDSKYATMYYCAKLPSKEFTSLFTSLIIEGYNQENFDKLVSLFDFNSTPITKNNKLNYNQLSYLSTIIATDLDKLLEYKNTRMYNFYYYLVLEKIRYLYCCLHDIDTDILYFGINYDKEFMDIFIKCLQDVNINDLKSLFTSISNVFNLDYSHYKILERIY